MPCEPKSPKARHGAFYALECEPVYTITRGYAMKVWFKKKKSERLAAEFDVITFARQEKPGALTPDNTPQDDVKVIVKPTAGRDSGAPDKPSEVERQAAAPVGGPREILPGSGKGAEVSGDRVRKGIEAGLPAAAGLSLAARKSALPVLTPVRMAARTAPVRLAPVSGSPAAAPVAAAAAGPAPVTGGAAAPRVAGFGLRPKTGVIAASPSASPAPGQALAAALHAPVERPHVDSGVAVESIPIRPKPDQRALYYQLMNGLYDAVLILDDLGHIVDCNTRVLKTLGYAREEMWDMGIDKIIPGLTSQMFEHLKRNLSENNHILIDARCSRKDGTSFAGEVGVSTLSLTRDTNIVFAIRNVDRRKNAMDELRKSRAALEVALSPAFVCDQDGFFQAVNQALLDAFGIPEEAQARTVRFVDVLPDAARFFLRAACGEKLRETIRVTTPEGGVLKIDLALRPVQSGQTVTGVAGSFVQI